MSEVQVKTERVDDIPLLIKQQQEMGVSEIIDRHISRHGLRQGLSAGKVVEGWLSHILSQSDHRLSVVEDWAGHHQTTLSHLLGEEVEAKDFTDDRLGDILIWLSDDETWESIEQDLAGQTIDVYQLEVKTIRLDTTTISMHHQSEGSDLVAHGHSKDYRPDLAQVKTMLGTLDPMALPIVTQVVSGNTADDGLYKPAIESVQACLQQKEVIYVGDSKMEALETRAHCAQTGDYYLHPLSQKGKQSDLLTEWVKHIFDNDIKLTDIYAPQIEGEPEKKLLAQAWETSRVLKSVVSDQTVDWSERLLVVYSPTLAQAGYRSFDKRLRQAEAELMALTPEPGRGRRQWRELAPLEAEAKKILSRYRLTRCFNITYQRHETQRKIRAYKDRPARTETSVRYQITLERNEEAIKANYRLIGWRLFATNAPSHRLALSQAVLLYRGSAPTIERLFARLKGKPLHMKPVFVRRDEALIGLARLLSLALRLLTMIEFVVRRSLQDLEQTLAGLVPGNPKMATASPTTERILRAFNEVTLSIIDLGSQTIRHLTPLNSVQHRILLLLKFNHSLYSDLANLPISV